MCCDWLPPDHFCRDSITIAFCLLRPRVPKCGAVIFFKIRPAVLSAQCCQSQWHLELNRSRTRLSPIGNATTFCTLQTCSVRLTHFSVYKPTISAFYYANSYARGVRNENIAPPSVKCVVSRAFSLECSQVGARPPWLKCVGYFSPSWPGRRRSRNPRKNVSLSRSVLFFLCSSAGPCVVVGIWDRPTQLALGGQGCEKARAGCGAREQRLINKNLYVITDATRQKANFGGNATSDKNKTDPPNLCRRPNLIFGEVTGKEKLATDPVGKLVLSEFCTYVLVLFSCSMSKICPIFPEI